MNRPVVAAILGLSLAGCVQDRTRVMQPRSTVGPVEMTPPMASIHDQINRERAGIDPDSVRASQPEQPAERPQVAAATPPADAVEGNVASAPAPGVAAGRPAPFAGQTAPQPRPRAGSEEARAALAVPPPVAEIPASTPETPVAASDQPEAPATELPADSAPVASPMPAPADVASSAPASDGRVPIKPPPGATGMPSPDATLTNASSPPPSGEVMPKAGSRDPLLGADPDIMPPLDTLPTPPPVKPPAPMAPPEGLSATAPVEPESPAQVVDPAKLPEAVPSQPAVAPEPAAALAPVQAAEPAAAVEPSTPEAVAPAPAELAPPVEAAAPATSDPLLGASPDVMPAVKMPDASAPAGPTSQGTKPVFQPQAGEPPSVRNLPSNLRTGSGPSPVVALPDATATPGAGEPPAAADVPLPVPTMPPAIAGPEASAPVPATPTFQVTVVQPDGAAGSPAPKAPAPQPAAPSAAAPASLPPVSTDPLLGADPDIMPALTLPPPKAKTAAPAPPVKPAPAASKPSAPAPAPQPPATPAADSRPSDPSAEPVELPPLSDPGPSASLARPAQSGFASMPVSPPAAPDPAAVRSEVTPRLAIEAGKAAAHIGDEVITLHELRFVYLQRLKLMNLEREPTAEQRYMLAKQILGDLIDRAVILQEARHELKDPKQYKRFMDIADKVWVEEEMPPLLRKMSAANIHELKRKLQEKGESIEEIREQFRLEYLSRGFMEQKIGHKMKVDLNEMQTYYLDHLKDFQVHAQITWREVLVEVDKTKSRAEARKKADALLARLQKGENFAVLARGQSEGPNKSDGGLWKTAPGGYAIPAVNAAIETLPIGKISPVIEGPTSFHIVVVEARRKTGPAPFAEVQDRIKRTIRNKKTHVESDAFIAKLRNRTLITTVFDDPAVVPASAERVSPAGPRPRR